MKPPKQLLLLLFLSSFYIHCINTEKPVSADGARYPGGKINLPADKKEATFLYYSFVN